MSDPVTGIEEEPDTGSITFIQSHRPPMEDGTYEVTVTQTVQNTNPNAPAPTSFNESYTNTRRFQIAGARFQLDTDVVVSQFPPVGSQGEYGNVLPHVVFSRQTLPWERTAGDADRSSWLALLLFDEDDPPPEVIEAMVGDLQRTPFPHAEDAAPAPSSLPDTGVSYPGFTLAHGEVMWDPCRVIDVPLPLFNAVLPGAVDLPWQAHSRTVSPEAPRRLGLAEEATELETSVVVCNRLPNPNTQCTVHLVSIENMAPLLPQGADYTPAAITLLDGSPAHTVRLVSLGSWTYRSIDPQATFAALLMNLDSTDNLRVLAIKNNSTGTTEADAFVANALNLGYTPVNHHTRQGDHTVSWYRGPLVPFEVPPTIFVRVPDGSNDTPPIQTADEAVCYEPETGMMDISYAAAWQIGRLLALQDKGFSVALARWKRANTRTVVESFERRALEGSLGQTLSLRQDSGRDGTGMQQAVARLILDKLKPNLVPARRGLTGEGGE